jgi:cytoskeletal protein CcmA (bactofilin family)
LHFVDCEFTDELAIEGANLQELHILRSALPGLIGNGIQTRRDLSLSGSSITGAFRTSSSLRRSSAVWLTESIIGGRLLAVGTQIETKADRAIQADRSRIAGDVRLVRGFMANAEIRLLAAQLDGSLDLTGSRLTSYSGRALDIAGAVIGGSVFFIDDPDEDMQPVVAGRVEMNGTVINDRLRFRRARLTAPKQGTGLQHYNTKDPGERLALIAPGLKVRGRLIVEESTIEGGLAFPGATIDGRVLIDGHIINPENLALDLSYSDLGASLDVVNKSTIKGTVKLGGIRVAGDIDFADANLSAPQRGYAGVRDCVYGAGARIAGDVRFARSTVTNGAINFRGSEIAGDMDANGATFINHGDRTVNLHYTVF